MVATTEMIRAARVSENGLSTMVETSGETQQAHAIALARAEMEGAIVVAKKFPRNEDESRLKVLKACKRPGFAGDVHYSFPRGGKTITGLSVYFAREAARLWGNIRWGADVIRDDEDERQIRCWAWDMEANVKVQTDDVVAKLIQRKVQGGKTEWVVPDERDLRELTNKRAALGVRNCILDLIPDDLKSEASELAWTTLANKAAEDPDGERKRIVDAFGQLNITPTVLEEYLGQKIALCTPRQLSELRVLWKSLSAGETTWGEIVRNKANGTEPAKEPQKPNGPVTGAALTGGKATTGKAAGGSKKPPVLGNDDLAKLIDGAATQDALTAAVEEMQRSIEAKVVNNEQAMALQERADALFPSLPK